MGRALGNHEHLLTAVEMRSEIEVTLPANGEQRDAELRRCSQIVTAASTNERRDGAHHHESPRHRILLVANRARESGGRALLFSARLRRRYRESREGCIARDVEAEDSR